MPVLLVALHASQLELERVEVDLPLPYPKSAQDAERGVDQPWRSAEVDVAARHIRHEFAQASRTEQVAWPRIVAGAQHVPHLCVSFACEPVELIPEDQVSLRVGTIDHDRLAGQLLE